MSWTASQIATANALSIALRTLGIDLGQVISDLGDAVNNGNLGITAAAQHVDALALPANAFAYDVDNSTGLNFCYFGGTILWNGSQVAYAANSGSPLALSASATNYVYAKSNGTIAKNTTSFAAAATAEAQVIFPLYVVTTSGSAITAVTHAVIPLALVGTAGITGALLSAAAARRIKEKQIGDVTATGTYRIHAPSVVCTLTALRISVKTTVAASDTNKYAFSAQNKGAAGTGTTDVLDTSAANSTAATGGSGLTAKVIRALTLHGTPANLVFAGGECLDVTFTLTGALTLADLVVEAEWSFAV